MIQEVIFIGAGLVLAGVAYSIIRGRRKRKEKAHTDVWLIPYAKFEDALFDIEPEMIKDGWSRADYQHPGHSCPQYTAEWCRRLRKKLSPHVPNGLKLFIYPFRFDRGPRPDGSIPNPSGHQVAAVRTDEGMFFVDNYRLPNGRLLRTLSDDEKLNGNYIYK